VIGVIPKADQKLVIKEFFELFKTPWEFYQHGRSYDVVIATVDDVPSVHAPLVLIYGTEITKADGFDGIVAGPRHRSASLNCDGARLPIYCGLLTFAETSAGTARVTADAGVAGLQVATQDSTVIRLGYDLFQEVRYLLTVGQPVEHAPVPALDLHIQMLRTWILSAGVPLVEIPPVPAGHRFMVCLTHDIDFVGIRRHRLDHTMWGFLYRSTVGALRNVLRGRMRIVRLLHIWRAVASLPLVYVGWARDFWDPFPWYLAVEQQLPATYFLIPFKGRPGDHVPGRHAIRRAAAYDVTDIPEWTTILREHGCEVGVHGIDAWHDVDKARDERARIAAATGEPAAGIRMHWLLSDVKTASVLETAGYTYDATGGYNETVGFRNGTTQTFRPFSTKTLLELPLHIQDGALFYPHNLDLSEANADARCVPLIDHAQSSGGALTVLWHDRSHGPERCWGDFYVRLVQTLRHSNAWFGTASQVVGWFRARRNVHFERVEDAHGARVYVRYDGQAIDPPLIIRRHTPTGRNVSCHHDARTGDVPWNGVGSVVLPSCPGTGDRRSPWLAAV
jgi:hypothetical protein